MSTMNKYSINSEIAGDTIIGEKTKFKGTINTDRKIFINGVFEGTINSTSDVIVGEKGLFDGTLLCNSLTISGEVRGGTTCRKLMKFEETGRFKGNAVVGQIDIKPQNVFDGGLKIYRD